MNIIVYKTDKTRKGNKSFLFTSVERKRSFGSEISRQEEKLHCQSFNSDKKN